MRQFFGASGEDSAYLLGVVWARGHVHDGGDIEVADLRKGVPLDEIIEASGAGRDVDRSVHRFVFRGAATSILLSGLGAPPGKGGLVRLDFPLADTSAELQRAFCRGFFDASGHVSAPGAGRLVVHVPKPTDTAIRYFVEVGGAEPTSFGSRYLRWEGAAALDLLASLYEGLGPDAPRRKKHEARYHAHCKRVVGFEADGSPLSTLKVELLRLDAQLPSKARVSDSGYDLTLLDERKRHGAVVLYGTGISVEPPDGWYLDVVARSSIVKRGYIVANSVGIIDRAYRGEILVPLIKIDPSAPDLELPARVMQLIPRPVVHFPVEIATRLSTTGRGAGGFGSTG